MKYVVSIMLLGFAFDSSAMEMIESATGNLKFDSQTAQNYKNLVPHKSWPRFYEFVQCITRASESEQELDINTDIKPILKIIKPDDYDFLKSSQQEFQSLSKIENKENFFMNCDGIIKRCIASVPREKFNVLLLNAIDEENTPRTVVPNDEVEETDIPQAKPPAKNRNRPDCTIS